MVKKDTHEETNEDIELTGEDNTEDTEISDIEELHADKLKTLRQKLVVCESEKADYLNQLQRSKADFLNSKKRLEEDRLRDRERAVNEHITRLLPLCDSFRVAMSNPALWEGADENWKTGIEGIYQQLKSLMADYDVSEIDPIGKMFDPNLHEAIGTRDSAEHPAETIIEVAQLGYSRQSEIIRAAKVILSN